jgi:hypothetical protein
MHRAHRSFFLAALLLLPLTLFAGDDKSSSSNKITPQTKLLVIRDLTAERVFSKVVIPRGEGGGLQIKDGKISPTDRAVAQMVAEHGFAAKPGDRVIITNVEIRERSIVLDINGGGKKKQKWYQHVSVGAGGNTTPVGGAPQSLDVTGSTVTIAFDKYVPELSGEQVRAMLEPVFDFKALTQAEAYEKTLPPKVQEAIKNHQILVGMDREMVIYAKGRPPKKIRDKDDAGVDYEEWIYGEPPQEVQFVRFGGNFVARLEIMTVDGEKIVRTQREFELPSDETQVADKQQQPPKPANAPTLRRPGEPVENSPQSTIPPPYPSSGGNTGPPTPGTDPGSPPHWQSAELSEAH